MPTGDRLRYAVFGLLTVAILGGIAALVLNRPAPVAITILPPPPTSTPGPVHVYVTGAVQRGPTTLDLPPGSRVSDAVQAAGGFAADADRTAVNVARRLRDGEQIHIPTVGESASAASAPVSANAPVHINRASAAELERLPGVGPSLARAILAYRDEHGPFAGPADLDKVSGVGQARLAQWEGLIVYD